MKDEIWVTSATCPERLEVSSLGRVRSIPRMTVRNGHPFPVKGKIVGATNVASGYVMVDVGRRSFVQAHRLIAEVFVPNPECKPFVNHLNGVKTDNRPENLEWCTDAENRAHARANELVYGKLSHADVRSIRGSELKTSVVAKAFGVDRETIRKIRAGQTWGDVI